MHPPPCIRTVLQAFCFQAVRIRVCAGRRARDHIKCLQTRYLINRLWEFRLIYTFGAVGQKDELIRFLGQEVKDQGHCETKYGPISTLGGVFSFAICRMHGHILMKLITIIQYQVRMTLMTVHGHGFKGQGHRQHVSKMHWAQA